MKRISLISDFACETEDKMKQTGGPLQQNFATPALSYSQAGAEGSTAGRCDQRQVPTARYALGLSGASDQHDRQRPNAAQDVTGGGTALRGAVLRCGRLCNSLEELQLSILS